MSLPDTLEDPSEPKLPRHDWILLPLLSILTLLAAAGFTEFIARRFYPTTKATGIFGCLMLNDPSGIRAIPNSTCHEKSPEGDQVEYHFNSCGHRAGMECGPKASGVYRIVMLGSSMTLGTPVPREKTFAALLPVQLSRLTGRKVELYNEAMSFRYPDKIASHFDEILAESPDLILWTINPGDLQKLPPELPTAAPNQAHASFVGKILRAAKAALDARSFSTAFSQAFERTRTRFLVIDALYDASQSQYVNASLMEGDEKVGYLRTQPTPLWQERLSDLNSRTADIESLAKKEHVPIITVLLPRHAEASMASMGTWPNGFDPYQLDREVRAIILQNGGTYIDILPYFRDIPNPQMDYFPVDTHLNPRGHAAVSELLARELVKGTIPQLKAATPIHPALATGK